MLENKRNKQALKINVIVFAIIGMVYYIFFLMNKLEESLFHPLSYGWIGIWISIVGGLSILEYYKYGILSLYKNAFYSLVYSIIYFFGFFIIPSIFEPSISEQIITVWLGLLLVSYFITFGAINWYFGFYIALFNIIIMLLTITGNIGDEVNPIVWVNILSLAGITNIYVQWAIVILSAILGLLEKGFDMFKIVE